MSCTYTGDTTPRIVRGRHRDGCPSQRDPEIVAAEATLCIGCQPCTEPHCRVCGRNHAPHTCPDCLTATRTNLTNIGRRTRELPHEVLNRGINGEAMTLIGPATSPESWAHHKASAAAGRIGKDWFEELTRRRPDGTIEILAPTHPLFVLGTWDMRWRATLGHDTNDTLTLAGAIAYLDTNLTYMADHVGLPFEEFVADINRCITHLEAVLHDQAYGDRANVGCFDCGGKLERKLTKTGLEDVWTCDRCRRRYTHAEYNFALRASLETELAREKATTEESA